MSSRWPATGITSDNVHLSDVKMDTPFASYNFAFHSFVYRLSAKPWALDSGQLLVGTHAPGQVLADVLDNGAQADRDGDGGVFLLQLRHFGEVVDSALEAFHRIEHARERGARLLFHGSGQLLLQQVEQPLVLRMGALRLWEAV